MKTEGLSHKSGKEEKTMRGKSCDIPNNMEAMGTLLEKYILLGKLGSGKHHTEVVIDFITKESKLWSNQKKKRKTLDYVRNLLLKLLNNIQNVMR